MTNLIFANNTDNKPKCASCIHSSKMITDGDFLCRKGRGIVGSDFKCRKYELNIMKMGNEKRRHLHNLANINIAIV